MGKMLCEDIEESDNESGPSIVEAAANKKLHLGNKIYVECCTVLQCSTAIITCVEPVLYSDI